MYSTYDGIRLPISVCVSFMLIAPVVATTCMVVDALTHYRPAMPFGNRKEYFRGSFEGSFQFSIVTISKPGLKQANTSMSVSPLASYE